MRRCKYGEKYPAYLAHSSGSCQSSPRTVPRQAADAAVAFEFVVGCAVGHGIVEAHLFAHFDVAQRHQRDLSAQSQIGIARMIDEVGRLRAADRGQIQALFDLHRMLLHIMRQRLQLLPHRRYSRPTLRRLRRRPRLHWRKRQTRPYRASARTSSLGERKCFPTFMFVSFCDKDERHTGRLSRRPVCRFF